MAHAVAQNFAAAEFGLFAVDGAVFFDFDEELGVGQADAVAGGGAEKVRVLAARTLIAIGSIQPSASPSPPFRGEREGPAPQAWQGEVDGGAELGSSAPLTLPSPGRRGERKIASVLAR